MTEEEEKRLQKNARSRERYWQEKSYKPKFCKICGRKIYVTSDISICNQCLWTSERQTSHRFLWEIYGDNFFDCKGIVEYILRKNNFALDLKRILMQWKERKEDMLKNDSNVERV